MCNFIICRCLHRRSRTWCSLCQLQTGDNIILTLEEMGHPLPPTPIHCNNLTTVGIANNTVKHQWSQSMGMRFFWFADAVEQDEFEVKYYPGKENPGDYQSKHHIGAHHTAVHPWYLHKLTSIYELPRAGKPSTLKGCVETLTDRYVHSGPFLQTPTKQSVPTSGKRLHTYFGIPILIPTLHRPIEPAITRAWKMFKVRGLLFLATQRA